MYGERSNGSRASFKRWITEILRDFGLSTNDFYGSTSDSGPDVKWMMTKGIGLQWEWCMPHLTNAAIKTAFGIASQRKASKNLPATALVSRIASTTFAVRSNASMGSLFSELCEMANAGATTQLIEHKEHRFMGFAKVVRRLLEKWDQLEDWFQERIDKAIRERKSAPEPFRIADDKMNLLQLLSTAQNNSGSNPARQRQNAGTNRSSTFFYQVRDLTRLVKSTRALLAKSFHKNFVIRYTDHARIRESSFIPEVQMLLHPSLKNQDVNLAKIVRLCNEQLIIDPEQPHLRMDEAAVARNIASVKEAVLKRLRALMLTISSGSTHTSTSAESYRMSSQHVTPQHLPPGFESLSSFIELPSLHPPQVFSEDLMEFAEEAAEHVERRNVHEARIDEELERWFSDPSRLLTTTTKTESILQFWKRQQDENNYRLLSIAARVIYAIPASSAQIERDFGISGMLVTSYRTSIAKHNIAMCSFLNRNRQFVDVVNCPRLTDSELEQAVPANVLVPLASSQVNLPFAAQWEREMASCLFDSELDENDQAE
ncbi:hypothetical protein F444_02566 [Phytophthora nicotianae P1976]|uniref:HAT C-terminal dimerisation domain-containing protein n=1 Tax=Phytophthora nicotianae P1976 TaxID=1317066 RepID=A0A081AWZ9_PHYNI|nr:hypothetical protein F444_02566 [Phytophthora nicotianae P1976]